MTQKIIQLIVTEECNLACKYCYVSGKKPQSAMNVATARLAIDYVLTHRSVFPEESVIWQFSGAEVLLEIETLDAVLRYFLLRSYELNHPWFSAHTFSLTTNGLLYAHPKTQDFIVRYREALDITISIDGPRAVHDRQRVNAAGHGSYNTVVKNIPLWISQFPNASTKVTITHDTIATVSESILHLFGLRIKNVNANVVFEDVWQSGDDERFEQELDKLGEEIVARGLWPEYRCSLFSRDIGKPLPIERDDSNWCGAGRMLAIDRDGCFYPCNRFMNSSLVRHQPIVLGNVNDGMREECLVPFLNLKRSSQSSQECITCEVARGCAWCSAFNYDDSQDGTLNHRATYICSMHHARVRANRRFWKSLEGI